MKKYLAKVVLIIVVVILVSLVGYFTLIKNSRVLQQPPLTPKTTTFENWLTYEWNVEGRIYKFKYPSHWKVKKDYYRGTDQESSVLVGLTLTPDKQTDIQDYIGFAGRQINCAIPAITKCINAGYGLDVVPIYTFSNNPEIVKVFDLIVDSIKNFGGEISYDVSSIKDVVTRFLIAKQHRNFDETKPFLTPEFEKTLDPIEFTGTSNPHISRFEFREGVLFSADSKVYKVKVRVYQEYTDEGEIGYNDNIFYIKQVGEKYLIDNIDYGQYIPLR